MFCISACLAAKISIHALRVEGDKSCYLHQTQKPHISIHALRVEGDPAIARTTGFAARFLSTPSGWRATQGHRRRQQRAAHFYPRPPGGGRLCCILLLSVRFCISIHALRVEGDLFGFLVQILNSDFYPRPPGGGRRLIVPKRPVKLNFYPRPPGGGRRGNAPAGQAGSPISIHALRVEGD